eukprot:jgi/Mesvir1/7417/Mv25804-RA.1
MSLTNKYHPATTDAHQNWRNAATTHWGMLGINLHHSDYALDLFDNLKSKVRYTLNSSWRQQNSYWVAFRRKSDGKVERYISKTTPQELSDMTKISNSSGIFTTTPTDIIDPYIPMPLRPVFHLSGEYHGAYVWPIKDDLQDIEFDSLKTNNPSGSYTAVGDVLELRHRSTSSRNCSIFGKYSVTKPVPGVADTWFKELTLTNESVIRTVVKCPDVQYGVQMNQYTAKIYGILPARQSVRKFYVRLGFSNTKLSNNPLLINVVVGEAWTGGFSTTTIQNPRRTLT